MLVAIVAYELRWLATAVLLINSAVVEAGGTSDQAIVTAYC